MSDDNYANLSDQQLLQIIDNARTALEQRMSSRAVDTRTVDELLTLVSSLEASLGRVNREIAQAGQNLATLRAKINELTDDDTGGGDTGGGDTGGGDTGGGDTGGGDTGGGDTGTTPADLAFPGAEGFGARSKGGRGGRVIIVTNLNDSGPGSFRDAVTQAGPRTVVFGVSGTITLNSRVVISGEDRSYLTIAGQTALDPGVEFKGHGIIFVGGVHDVIVRNIRVRMGGVTTSDTSAGTIAIYGNGASNKVYNFIFDHCSFYWGYDETGQAWDYCENITWQWCIFEGINHRFPNSTTLNPGKALLVGALPNEGSHIRNITIHRCYFANTSQRNPAITGDGPFYMINNLIYNWQAFGTQLQSRGGGCRLNLIGNYYKRGPASNIRRYAVGIEGPAPQPDGLIYVRDNIGPFRTLSNQNDWDIMGYGFSNGPNGFLSEPAPRSKQRSTPWPDAPVPVTVIPAEQVADEILDTVGALPRDAVDERTVNDYRRGTGTIKTSSQLQPSDWANFSQSKTLPDSDRDGMPDLFERINQLDSSDPSDRNDISPTGYTRIEDYLNQVMSQYGA